jgi:hypothetical protein
MKSKRRKSRRPKAPKSREFCVVHPDGRISDAELHEPILAGDHLVVDEIGREVARRAGLSEDEIKKLYR